MLQGQAEWLLEGASELIDQVAQALDGVCERLGDRLLLLDFGNAVGFFEVPGLGTVEVVSGKADRQQFNRMLAELTEIASGLPFAASITTALPYDRSAAAQEDVLYHAFVYLRYVLSTDPPGEDRLLPALQTILRDPHRRLERLRRLMPIGLASRVEPSSLIRMATGQAELASVGEGVERRLPLARKLRGHLPVEVEQSQVQLTYDTPENRFVKTFLEMVLGMIERMRKVASSSGRQSAFTDRIKRDCEQMERLLRPVVRHPMWKEVGPMVHLPAASTVLHRRRGYRDAFRHFSRLRLAARVPFDGELT